MIDERSGMKAVGDLDQFLKFKAAKAMGDAARSGGAEMGEGGAASGMGIGLGAGLGMMIPGILQKTFQQGGEAPRAKCPKCHSEIPLDSRFCSHCGHQIVIVNKCGQCGADLPVEANFCMVCGVKVEKQEKKCPHCGSSNLPQANFCNKCGEKL